MASPQLELLLNVLSERDTNLTRDDVGWAFEDATTRKTVESWMKEHLSDATLLSPDELAFFDQHGVPHHEAHVYKGSHVTDAELEHAIQSLEASTAALHKQSQILEAQKRVLSGIASRTSQSRPASGLNTTRGKRLVREKAQLDFDSEKLSRNLNDELNTFTKQADTAVAALSTQSERLLERDDRLLDGLQKLIPRIADLPNQALEPFNPDQLCNTLGTLMVKEIRSRLDFVFRESAADYLQNADGALDLTEQQLKQRDTLRAEISELTGEIEGLVPLIVDQQYQKPIARNLHSAQSDLQAQRDKWTEYVTTALLHMTARLDTLDKHIIQVHGHHAALQSVSTALEEIAATQQTSISGAKGVATPEKAGERGLKPLRLVQANLTETSDPALHLLRQFDLGNPNTGDVSKLVQYLDSAINKHHNKASRLHRMTEASLSDTIAQSLHSMGSDLQALSDAAYSHSTSNRIQLVEDDVQACFTDVESNTQRLGDEMRELDLEALASSIRRKQALLLGA